MTRRGRPVMIGVLPCAMLVVTATLGRAQIVGRDSAGVRIMENMAAAGPTISLGPTPALTIGAGEDAGFTLIVSARITPTGDVAIADLHDRSFRLFDGATGDMRLRVGRAGEGPREFGAAPSLAVDDNGSIRAWDPGNRRITHWDREGVLLDGENLAGQRTAGVPNAFTPGVFTVAPDGLVLTVLDEPRLVGSRWEGAQSMCVFGAQLARPRVIGPELASAKVFVDDIHLGSPFSLPRRATLQFGQIVATHPDGSWQLDIYDRDGTLVRLVRAAIPRRPVDDPLIKRERGGIEGYFEPRVFEQLFEKVSRVDSTSAIADVHASHDGTLWVTRWRSLYTGSDSLVLDAFDDDGTWVATVRLPPDAGRILDVAFGRIATVWYDEMRVPFVKVFDLPSNVFGAERARPGAVHLESSGQRRPSLPVPTPRGAP